MSFYPIAEVANVRDLLDESIASPVHLFWPDQIVTPCVVVAPSLIWITPSADEFQTVEVSTDVTVVVDVSLKNGSVLSVLVDQVLAALLAEQSEPLEIGTTDFRVMAIRGAEYLTATTTVTRAVQDL